MKDDKNYHDGNSKDNKMNQTLALTKVLSQIALSTTKNDQMALQG